jgi:transposase InsO family protein
MRKPRDVVRLRLWCIRKRGEGVPVHEICTNAQIPRRTFYNWRNRYRLGGLEGLNSKPRTPHTIHRTPPETVEKILTLRREKGWCPILIEGYLRRAESIMVGHTTIYRLLRQAGLNNPLQKPRQRRSYRRWQRRHPNSLWQCDLKQAGARWLITNLDDHSRFVPASEHFREGTTENVIWLLDKAIHEYAKPREILTDHGSQFWSVRRGDSRFDSYCHEKGIKHILGGIGKPTTLGKVERWFRTYDQEHSRFTLHRKFIEYYNYERPHMALDYSTPAEVYFNTVPNVMG